MAIFQNAKSTCQIMYAALQQTRNHKIWVPMLSASGSSSGPIVHDEATKRKSKTSVDAALDYFDNVYGTLYGKSWPSIRLAMLCPHKYCAVVNNFANTEEICSELQNDGAINMRDMIDVQKNLILEQAESSRKKKKHKKKVYNINEKLEKLAIEKRDQELDRIYPKGADRVQEDILPARKREEEQVLSKEELIKQAKSPLEKGLLDAVIDWDRQIDPSEGLSSSRLNEFVPVSKLKGKEDFVSEAEHFSYYNDSSDFPVTVESEDTLNFPPQLKIYTFDPGNISTFKPAKSGPSGLSNYYLMDAGSILPVLALDLRPGDNVLDMCAAPGGKSYVCLQTLYPESMVCNDMSISRTNRLRNVMNQFFQGWEQKVTITSNPGATIEERACFSKILVDVPCTNDRLSVNDDENNIFKSSRIRERILLPEQQVALLFQALKLVKLGGSVVYSTCSLNPAQNDGVVQMALRRVWEETSLKIVVKDLSEALEPAKIVFKFAEPHLVRYGSLVVPYLPSNFGPMYFCKLQRVE